MAETTVLLILSIAVPSIFRDWFWAHFGLGLGFWGFFCTKVQTWTKAEMVPGLGRCWGKSLGVTFTVSQGAKTPYYSYQPLNTCPQCCRALLQPSEDGIAQAFPLGILQQAHLKLSFCKLSATGPHARQTHMDANGNRTQPGSRAAWV